MHVSKLVAGLLGAAILAAAVPAAATVVNVSGLGPEGTTVDLAAGTYVVTMTASDYSPWSSTTGCDINGMNCSTGYTSSFAIDYGFGTATFNHADGFQIGRLGVPGNNGVYETPAQSLAAFQTGPLYFAPLPVAALGNSFYSPVGGDFTFTLAAAQKVNFFLFDYPYGDNRGGITLNLAKDGAGAVPEPGTWALMILGFGGAGAALRRRKALVA